MSPVFTRGAVAGLAIAFCACGSETSQTAEESRSQVAGECADAWGAEICTWAVMDGDAVVEVGATIPLATLEAAPADAPFTWPPTTTAVVPLPAAAEEQRGLTHLTFLWEAMGHPPATFLTPHFDFHFYLIPSAERLALECSEPIKASNLPEGYSMPDEHLPPELVEITGVETLVGVCVPEMGMHAMSTVEMENPDPFDGTMIVGYWEETPIFIEPMISRAYLLERQSFDLTVPAIPGLEGTQPTAFRAEYDAEQDAYRFTLSGFTAAD